MSQLFPFYLLVLIVLIIFIIVVVFDESFFKTKVLKTFQKLFTHSILWVQVYFGSGKHRNPQF